MVPVVVLVAVLLPHSLSHVSILQLWERQNPGHDGSAVCGDAKQNLLCSRRQGWPWGCVECTISLTKVS